MRSYSFEGIILKRINIGEADKLITFFTKEKGKITLKVRGLRKISSKRAGSLELFNLVKASAVKGRGTIDTLTEVQVLAHHGDWKNFLGKINLAYQLCEVIDKILPEEEAHPQVFRQLSDYLSQISYLKNDWESQMRIWLISLLVELGYWPQQKEFTGDINQYIENIVQRPINSPRILNKLRSR
jgi:DNA repair protein RecO (recombination protein O)